MYYFISRLGSWQFLAELPYHDMSIGNLWRILLIMHEKCYHDDLSSDPEPQQTGLPCVAECQNKLQGIVMTYKVYFLSMFYKI